MEAEAYLNSGENTKALNAFKTAIEKNDGEWKARAIIGYASARFNLIYGEDGLFFLETAIVMKKLADNSTDNPLTIFPPTTWKNIKDAYTESQPYLDLLARIGDSGAQKYKMDGAFLAIIGGLAKIVDTMNTLGNTLNGFQDLDPSKMTPEDAITIVETMTGAVGIDVSSIQIPTVTSTGTDATSFSSGTAYRFKTFPQKDMYYTKSSWDALKNHVDSQKTLIAYTATNSTIDTSTGKPKDPSPNNDLGVEIQSWLKMTKITDPINNPLGNETQDSGTNIKTTEIWWDNATGEYVLFADSLADGKAMEDLMKANANGGTGMNAIQEQMLEAMIENLYKQ
ncbi:MAG: hypothetical protein A2Y41_01805 [Spirochaetes bacterium GWB1_36_13]|nr:MAG: hypothetical protein A2Y41_01805 [Spirochaetes bacterium GWB1_36_13]